VAYEWCSVVCKNRRSCEDWKSLVLYSLEIGFRHLDPSFQWFPTGLTNTEHHRELLGVVFESKEGETIADLLQAWTMRKPFHDVYWASTLLRMCTGYIVGLHNLVPFSPRLRRLVVRSVERIGYERFVEGGAERFVELLNHLRVGVEDTDSRSDWMEILLNTIQSPEGTRRLFVQSWEFLAELITSSSWGLVLPAYNSQVTASLLEAQEWEKLECWMGVVWMVWPPQTNATTEDLEHVMVPLLCQRPGAVRKLTQWMDQWSERHGKKVPEAFKRICEQPHEAAQLGAL
jgi:hypothetical protein